MKNQFYVFIIIFLIVVALVTSFFLVEYYIAYKTNECLKEPLVFGAKYLTEETGYEFVGTGFFKVPSNKRSPTITFNSSSIKINS